MNPLLAQVSESGSMNWQVIQTLGVLAALALNTLLVLRGLSGNGQERQIEPTSLHSITSELRTQTLTLNKLDREMGGVVTSISSFHRELAEIKVGHSKDISDAHARIGGISRDLAATAAKVEGLEKRETHRR